MIRRLAVGVPLTVLLSVTAWLALSPVSSAPGDTVADRVFGQGGSFNSALCNPEGTSATSLCFSSGVAVDSVGNVFVADAFNNRVLEYDTPLTTDTIADRVFGQGGSFTTGGCNDVGTDVSNGLCTPLGIAVDGAGNLYVADKDNSRVLEYDTPLTTDTVPDRVFGQADSFTSSTCNLGGISASSLCTPSGVGVDAAGNLYVVDPLPNSRVLEYDTPLTTDTVADRVLGQPNFTTGTCNTAGLGSPPTANTLCTPAGVDIDNGGNVYVADASNNRVLEYDVPLTTDSAADRVFGQGGSFNSDSCNVGASGLCAPQATAVDATANLYIVDVNSRVLEYDTPLTTDLVADRVLGQPDFNGGGCNQDSASPTASSLCYPIGATVDGSGNLYVADTSNNRVLEYDVPLAVATPTPTAPAPNIHDAGVSRVGAPTSVRLRPGVPDSNNRVTVVARNNGDHADSIGVYLAFLPPGGSGNEGGCSPAAVQNLGALTLLPGDRLTVSTAPSWQCANPASVHGATWTLKAIADVHGDDFASCSTLQQVFSGQCSAALADDDNGTASNTLIRARPKVVALNP